MNKAMGILLANQIATDATAAPGAIEATRLTTTTATLGPATVSLGQGSAGAVRITGLKFGETISAVSGAATASGDTITVPTAAVGTTAYTVTTSTGRTAQVSVSIVAA